MQVGTAMKIARCVELQVEERCAPEDARALAESGLTEVFVHVVRGARVEEQPDAHLPEAAR